MARKKVVKVSRSTDPATGNVLLYVKDQAYGPIVIGKTFDEAKKKLLASDSLPSGVTILVE